MIYFRLIRNFIPLDLVDEPLFLASEFKRFRFDKSTWPGKKSFEKSYRFVL